MQDNSCHDIDSSTERETRLPTGLGTAPGRHVTRSARLLKVIMLVGAVLIFALLLLMLDSIGPQFQTGTGAGPPDKSLVLRMLSDQRDNSKDMNTLLTGVREDLCHWVQIECDDGNTTAAELAGVTQNHEGTDQNGLVFALTFYGTLCIVCVLSFSFLRLYSPLPLSFFEDETEKNGFQGEQLKMGLLCFRTEQSSVGCGFHCVECCETTIIFQVLFNSGAAWMLLCSWCSLTFA